MTVCSLDITRADVAARVLDLQRQSYEVEAALIGRRDLPPLHETLEDLRACGETFFGVFEREQLAGAVSYKRLGDTVDVHRVMVRPAYFRRGVARTLVTFVETCEEDARRFVVSTGSLNAPAKRLYAHLGFREMGEREVAPGLTITEFEKTRG
ncbi:GNAT family N-acetyltransferase [Deinococcus yavapaiensis]|uniref:Ribosomal protein S18 acetylase RimI-like enzyme n=1 Tax=Deinococcus yavapaiensis KR-236 TaxID=694435 RepID=A0A318S9I3_9DEIO|nr:GNAT family N-acetyltransferase [Deinococcus yavapaiensis]PYE55385.1 ribosomal protein S18 acetylase RimI-like enzyme [Deinococcus yavapaiensis KR-236]